MFLFSFRCVFVLFLLVWVVLVVVLVLLGVVLVVVEVVASLLVKYEVSRHAQMCIYIYIYICSFSRGIRI